MKSLRIYACLITSVLVSQVGMVEAQAESATETFGCAAVAEIEIEARSVKTTAYSHGEADHLRYGNMNAIGTPLRYGSVRSAAADWSRFPLGTKFRLINDPETLYVVDDYGSALVGKETIDLYKPTMKAMRQWGTRHVDIEIVEWGSFEESLRVLKPRAPKAHYVKRMVWAIEERMDA